MEEEEDTASAESGLDFEETELKLALPGDRKRGFGESLGLRVGRAADTRAPPDRDDDGSVGSSESKVSGGSRPPVSKIQVVGWPPLVPSRKNVLKNYRYVKVAVDGAPYLRKVNLEMYNSYQELLKALEEMFSCFTIRKFRDEQKLVDLVNGVEYVPTYEDKEGDWMLVGDVPWKMFVETCKRLRLMKHSEVVNQAALELPQ